MKTSYRLFPLLSVCFLALSLGSVSAQRTYVPSKGKLMVRELDNLKGFEVVNTSADGPHLLARIPNGDMSQALQNPTFRWILDCYSRFSETSPARPLMNMADYPQKVEPLLTDLWHQFAPYNALTPRIGNQSCATGCVAHAMAQVIRYHRYASGNGTYTYTDTVGCGQTLTAEFPVGGYDFGNMLDVYEQGAYTSAELAAVATLLHDCGILVHMQYGVESSGAYSVRQPMALAGFFGYDKGMQMCYRDFYAYSEWERMLRKELAEGRPVLMSAQSPSLSHAFCCDGYDEQGLFHLNLGMAGDADGYYYLPYLTPKQPEWYDEDNPEGGMNLLQYMTIGVRPACEETVERHSYAFSGISALRSEGTLKDTLQVVTSNLSNVGWNIHHGKVSLLLKKDDQTVHSVAEYPHDFKLLDESGISYTDTLSFLLPSDVKEGAYRLVPCFEEDNGVWAEARTSVGTPNYLWLIVEEDSVHLRSDEESTAYLTLNGYEFPDTVVRATKPPFSISLRCHRSEFCGRFYVILSPESNPDDLRIIQYQGLTLSGGEETLRQFNRTHVGLASGAYHLRVAYDCNLFTDSLVWLSEEPLKTVYIVEPETPVCEPECEDKKMNHYDMNGIRMPEGLRPRGLVIQQGENGTRKIIIK